MLLRKTEEKARMEYLLLLQKRESEQKRRESEQRRLNVPRPFRFEVGEDDTHHEGKRMRMREERGKDETMETRRERVKEE